MCAFSGAPMKVLASDVSRFEREARVPGIVLAPAERYVVEVRFDHPGTYALVNAVQAINHYKGEFEQEVDTLGLVTVDASAAAPDYRASFDSLRENPSVTREIDRYRRYFDRPPDKTIRLTVRTSELPLATVQFMGIDTAYLRSGGVGGRHADDELALHQQPGPLDPAGRGDRPREQATSTGT